MIGGRRMRGDQQIIIEYLNLTCAYDHPLQILSKSIIAPYMIIA